MTDEAIHTTLRARLLALSATVILLTLTLTRCRALAVQVAHIVLVDWAGDVTRRTDEARLTAALALCIVT